jgi:hypothetical protein
MASPGGTTTISLSLSPWKRRSSSWTDHHAVLQAEPLGDTAAFIEALLYVIRLGVNQVHLLVAGPHGIP